MPGWFEHPETCVLSTLNGQAVLQIEAVVEKEVFLTLRQLGIDGSESSIDCSERQEENQREQWLGEGQFYTEVMKDDCCL